MRQLGVWSSARQDALGRHVAGGSEEPRAEQDRAARTGRARRAPRHRGLSRVPALSYFPQDFPGIILWGLSKVRQPGIKNKNKEIFKK